MCKGIGLSQKGDNTLMASQVFKVNENSKCLFPSQSFDLCAKLL